MEFLQSKKTVAVLVTTLLGLSEEVVVGKGASLDFTISTAAGETTQQVHDARGVPPPPSMADDDLSCVDLAEAGTRECQKWAKIGECEKNPGFMHKQCRKSCGLCDPGDMARAMDCVDWAEAGVRQCREWAWLGQCETNAEFMHDECMRSCGLCGDGDTGSPVICEDVFENCAEWGKEGLCHGTWEAKKGEYDISSSYVVEFCPVTCGVCDIHLDHRDMDLNIGLPQSAPDIDDKHTYNKVRAKVAETRDYIASLEDQRLRDVCKLSHPYCARFALSSDCTDHADDPTMKYNCAASCQTCELLEEDDEEMDMAEEAWIFALMEYKNQLKAQSA